MKSNYYHNYFDSFFNTIVNTFSSRFVPPVTTVSGTDVNIGQGLSYTVKASGLSVHGNQGSESVTIPSSVSNIKVDGTVESIVFSDVNYTPTQLVSSQGSLTVNSAAGSAIATLTVTANHNESISFANASGTLSLDSSGKAIFNLSDILLDKNQSYTANVNNLRIYGNAGTEKVTLDANVAGIQISNSVESVSFSGNASDYSYTVQNNGVDVTNKNTGKEIAFINVNPATTGTQIQFADKTLTATWNDTVSWNKGWTLHNWQISVVDPTAPATPSSISGGTNLQYNVDFSHANLGNYLANVEASVKTALENLGKYISSKAVLNLEILTENTSPKTLAESTATMVNTSGANGVTQTTSFLAEAAAGTNLNGSTPDATVYINLADINQLSFSGTPAANKYDLTSILTHEILHGIAFTGNLDQAGSSAAKTPYDALVSMQNNSPVFTGTNAKTANKNAVVPLTTAAAGDGSAYYHVAVANDLMSDSLAKGQIRAISALDVGMLQDMGVTVVGVPSAQAVI